MKLIVKHQETYSRLELLLRTFFGAIYILIPHGLLLIFVGLWGLLLQIAAFWVILFTGKYPKKYFDYQVGLQRWNLRVNARLLNLCDGYPAFGINATDDYTLLEVEYPENVDRGLMLLRFFFGAIYVYLPHFFILFFRALLVQLFVIIAWWIVLFTGRYPKSLHNWVTGQLRWTIRITLYMSYLTDKYPAFTGDPLPEEE